MAASKSCVASIKPANVRDASWIAHNMRERDWAEASCQLEHDIDKAFLGMKLVTYPGFHWTAWLGSKLGSGVRPVGVFGFVASEMPWLYSAYALGTDEMPRVIPAISRFCVEDGLPMLLDAGCKRCEVRVKSDYKESIRWLCRMGAKHEGCLVGWGKNGEDFNLMAWTDANLPTSVFAGKGKNQPSLIMPMPDTLKVG